MKIVCPSCAATYEVPEAVVAGKRSVRCARCGNNWAPGSEPAAVESASASAPAAATPPPAAPPPHSAEPVVAQAAPGPVVAQAAPEPEVKAAPAPVAAAMPEMVRAAEAAARVAESPAVTPPPRPAPAYVPPPAPGKPVQAAPAAKTAVTATVKPVRQTPVIGWVASIAALIIIGSVGIVYRSAIMKSWPPSERAYAAVGLYHQ